MTGSMSEFSFNLNFLAKMELLFGIHRNVGTQKSGNYSTENVYNLKFVKMEFFSQIGSVCPFVNIFLCSIRHRAKPKRPKDQNHVHGHRLRIETGSSRSPVSNGTMSNSPEVRIEGRGKTYLSSFQFFNLVQF